MNFSEKMAELEKILHKLEDEVLPLEESLALFERGVTLVRECGAYLEDAKQKVTILSDGGEPKERDRAGKSSE
jgi:exodeoxyribonuclease VII small subunit